MVQAYATEERIPCGSLSDKEPTSEDILGIPLDRILPSETDEQMLKNDLENMVERILIKKLPFLSEAKTVHNIKHIYSQESKKKSKVVSCDISNTWCIFMA